MKQKIIKNPLNYTGSKDRILPLILNNLPKNYNLLVDLFGGSGVLSVNIPSNEKIIYNEKNVYVYNIIKTLSDTKIDNLFDGILRNVYAYNLDKFNKDSFYEYRKIFNETSAKYLDSDIDWARRESNINLLSLIYYSFNYFITFKDGKYINTSGYKRSSFNNSIQSKLYDFCYKLQNINMEIQNLDFKECYKNILKEKNNDLSDVFFIIDPPYLISDSNLTRTSEYNWTQQNFDDLIDMCNNIDKHGGKFMLFDMLEKDGVINDSLLCFSKCYKTIDTGVDFKNSSYQRKNKKNTKEIMIVNY